MNDQTTTPWLRKDGVLLSRSELERLPARPAVRRVGDIVYVGAARDQKMSTFEHERDSVAFGASGLARLTLNENLTEDDVTENLRLKSVDHPLFGVAQSVRSAILFSLSCLDASEEVGGIEEIESCVSFSLQISSTAGFDSIAFLRVTAARFLMNALTATKRPAADAFGVTALPGDALVQISAIYQCR